ncbi:hypothetical protein ACX0HA_16265 [Flavobacterium hauense]
MTYFKIMPYLFLVFAALFLVDAVTKLIDGGDPVVSFLFAGVGIFMFFFRRNSYKKFNNNKNE